MWRVYAASRSVYFKSPRIFRRGFVTGEEIEKFQEHGAVCLRGVFDDWVEKLKRGIERNHKDPSQLGEWLKSEESESFYFNDMLNWRRIPEFEDFVFNSHASEIAGKLMTAEYSLFYYEHVFTKDPGTNRATPWHHDQSYYPVDGWKNCSLWLPVTPVSKASCLQYVAGSHRWGKWFIPRKFASSNNYQFKDAVENSDKVFEEPPDIDAQPQNYELLAWDLEPGDCIAFHMQTLHGAKQSVDNDGRQVVATRWLGEDARFAERPWQPSPNYSGGLKPGQPFITSKAFPLVWRKEIKGM